MKNSQRVVIIGGGFAGVSLEDLLGEDGNTTVIFAHPDPGNIGYSSLLRPTKIFAN
tara:strand:+ start:433 stop:600 length:168 start_codon:yes stop_codon:yes gene_type:complete